MENDRKETVSDTTSRSGADVLSFSVFFLSAHTADVNRATPGIRKKVFDIGIRKRPRRRDKCVGTEIARERDVINNKRSVLTGHYRLTFSG